MSTTASKQIAPHRVRLGRSELRVSPICYGTWQMSPRFWGEFDEATMSASIRRAFELGINFFDTADAYGDGLSEQVLGRAIRDLPREELVIATKLYHHILPDARRYGDLSGDYVPQACEASLRRMGIDHIDLYQCHSFDPLTHPAETAAALDKLVQQGKIRAYGLSNWNPHQMALGHRFGNFATSQPKYSLIDRAIEEDVLPYCLAHDMGVLVYSPLHNGLLSGKYTGGETFTDLRKGRPDFQGERYKLLCQRVREAAAIGADYGLSSVQLMLAATLMHPAITCAIVGIKNAQQIEDAAGATGKTISRDDWHRVRALLSVPKA
jgi:aryl-alcohol dehydrogenase-like predicted oxidoreductase